MTFSHLEAEVFETTSANRQTRFVSCLDILLHFKATKVDIFMP